MIAEAARVLAPGGLLLAVDFDRHTREELRANHAHVHLGLSSAEIESWFDASGLDAAAPISLPGATLTVMIWRGHKPALEIADAPGDRRPATDERIAS